VWVTPSYGNNLDRSLSRSIDLTGYADSTLSFDDRCDTEAGYDFGQVEISVNSGTSWTTLYQCSGRTSWQANRVALPASTDNLADLRLRFRLTSDTSVTNSGWAIDNIEIESGGAECRAEQNDRIFADGFEP
jgi:immune inhibitor A